ncbi:MAG: molybdate ABC transporter substrate-binding protein [Lautropia sp.]
MNPRPLLALAVAASALFATAAHAVDLTVSAAASLTNAFRDIAPLFEAEHPGTTVRLNFGSSGALLQQIAKGAPADVFASADQQRMDQAQAQQLITPALRRDFAANALVVIVPAAAKQQPAALADLSRPAYARIAIGLPASVPVGSYARRVLEAAGLWAAIEPKMIGASNVRQALDYVARAEVDAGFVYATDAAVMRDKVKVALTVPTGEPIRYPVAPIAASANADLAARFVAFLGTPAAQAVLARRDFARP